MKFVEFGKEHAMTVMLLHGGGLSWWNYREAAEYLSNGVHVILPILDGHAGSDRPFTTIEDNAAEIISFIDEHYDGYIRFIGGLSLGGQVLLEMLSRRRYICSYALVESAAVIPSKLTNKLIAPMFGSSYGLIKNKNFAKLQFKSLHMPPELFEDYYRDTCRIAKEDMIAFMKASTSYTLKDSLAETWTKVHVFYGTKETGTIKRSAALIEEKIDGCKLHSLQGYYHGDFSINHPDSFADEVSRIIW